MDYFSPAAEQFAFKSIQQLFFIVKISYIQDKSLTKPL